jgi:hypothetical protein
VFFFHPTYTPRRTIMTHVNLAEVARARRVRALASLASREVSLFDPSEQRVRGCRTSTIVLFRSNRTSSAGNVVNLDILKKAA